VTQRRRLPAYAAELVAARRRGLVPRRLGFGHVCVVLDWENHATAGLHRLVLPPKTDLQDLDLGCLAGLDVLLTHREVEAYRAAGAVNAILAAGARRVDAVDLDAVDRGEDLLKTWPVFDQVGARHAA
jgi:hypothetical protein